MHTARSRSSVISHGCCSNSAASSANAAGAGHDLLRRCELCREEAARVYCAADEAQLCWGCDERIHSANFLVARHPRALLCPSCGAFLRGTTSTPASATQQLICYTCRGGGGWLDSDEESKILDESGADQDFEDDYGDDDQEDQNSSRGHDYQSRSGGSSSGHSRKLNVQSRPWSANGRIQQNYDDRGLPSEEGMGDSQDEDYGISH